MAHFDRPILESRMEQDVKKISFKSNTVNSW